MRGTRRRLFRARTTGLAATLLALAAVVTAAPAAQAGAATPLRAPALAVESRGAATAQNTTTVTNGFWSCTLSARYPGRWHGGTGGGVQGFGYLNCSHVMPEMLIEAGVFRGTALVAYADNYRASGVILNAGPSMSPYSPGTYYTAAVAAVRWPDNTITQIQQVNSVSMTL